MDNIIFRPTIQGNMISVDHVIVNLSESYHRKSLPEEYEDTIDEIWRTKIKNNSHLWNGTKFRLNKCVLENEFLNLELGITDYKDFLGTNYSDNATMFQTLGQKNHGDPQCYLANPLGVGSIVLSSDKSIVLIRRSQHCGEAVGLLDVPGGHPEPQEVFDKDSKTDIDSTLMDKIEKKHITKEIFKSILREVRDEVNIPLENLDFPLLMGIAGNEMCANRPSAEFLIRCNLTQREIKSLYNAGSQSESYESTNILCLPVAELNSLESSAIWKELTPSAQSAIKLYTWHTGISSA